MRVIESQRLRVRSERLTLLDNLLRKRMPQAIEVCILDVFAAAIRAGMNLLLGERVLDKGEPIVSILELGIGLEIEPRQLPEPCIVLAQNLATFLDIDPKLFVNLFIEVL